jgi:hypothetical protein
MTSLSLHSVAATVQEWFDGLPPQDEGRSLSLELPDGRAAPNADGLIVPTEIAVEGDELVIRLDPPVELRFRGIARVTPVSEAELRLEDVDALEVTWKWAGQCQTRRYRNSSAGFTSLHLVGTEPAEPRQGVRWENPL